MKRPALASGWLTALLAVTASATGPAQRTDYAYGFALETGGPAELYSAAVTLAVYRAVTDPALRDTAVFNAAGRAVPRMFEQRAGASDEVETLEPLTLVPLYGAEDEQSEQLRLMLRSDPLGTTVQLDTGAARAEPSADRTPAAYIVDLREMQEPLVALEFSWPDPEQGFIGEVRIDHGSDLRQWRRLATATLADLRSGDVHIEQHRVELHSGPEGFLRISWSGLPRAWQLGSLAAVRSGPDADAARDWVTLDPLPGGGAGRELLFDAEAYLPIDRAQLVLPSGNIAVRGSLDFQPEDDTRWLPIVSGVFYRWSRESSSVQSGPVDFPHRRARYLRLRIESGLLDGPVQLRLGWQPDRLLFLAQGEGPFELAAGRGRDAVDRFPQERRLGDPELFRVLLAQREPGTASIAARRTLGGAERLVAEPGKPGRLALLWAGLIGAVALVGWLAWSLLREMRK